MTDNNGERPLTPTELSREITAMKVARVVESTRADRAEGIENDRADRAEGIENDRADRAVGVETDRVDRAEVIESNRVGRAEKAEDRRLVRATTVRRQMLFLFGLILIAFVILAYRTEQSDRTIEAGLYEACEKRSSLSKEYNAGREGLVQLVITNPNSTRTPAERQVIAKQLRDGLLLPVEECGDAP